MCDLTGKTALITGGSRGIGRTIALELAKNGANIVINYTESKNQAEYVKEEIEQLGRHCILAKADLTRSDCADEIYKMIRQVDILVLNASIQFRNNWRGITLEEFEKQTNCNFRAALLLMQKFSPHMIERHWGRIITIGSVQEVKPHPDMLIYASLKAALTFMARSLAVQLAPYGVTVNSIAPGVIITDRNKDVLSDQTYLSSVLENIPAGFCGTPQDCASILRLLCSEEARYITGQNIFVDGGMGVK